MLAGTKLGRYEIRRKIGAGGMGEVFLAHDEQLDRNVALKVLLPEFCCDEERVQRFKLEARTVSGLNHPNIITIHEIGEENERLYIATEFVDGITLREKIEKGDISLFDALLIGEQVADALSVAHEAHIIHRDIKPENIMIRHDGYVKILDFGLAKPSLLKIAAGAEDETVRLVKTQPGMVMGSVRYMSPEQARGKETDQRTDVWSLGVVLYEMLTGKNPFEGETISDSLAALIHVEPLGVEDVPEELSRIIRKSLRKNAAERYHNIKDLALDLKDLRGEIEHDSESRIIRFSDTTSFSIQNTSESKTLIHQTISAETDTNRRSNKWSKTEDAAPRAKTSGWRFLPIGFAAIAIILAFGAWYYSPALFGGKPGFEQVQLTRLTSDGKARAAAVSPDGKFVAFVNFQEGRQSLVVRQVAAGSEVQIVPPTNLGIMLPRFTPDGNYIYYVLEETGVGTLYQIPTLGGESKKLVVDVDSPVTFAPDGKTLAFYRHNPNEGGDTIFTANADGSNLQTLLQTKDVGYDKFTDIAWSPDGERMIVGVFRGASDGVRKMEIAVLQIKDKKLQHIGNDRWLKATGFQWLDDSSFVFVGKADMGDTMQIWQMTIPNGELKPVTTDTNDYGSLSISADGSTMVATRVDTISSFWSLAPGTRELKQLTGESKTLLGYSGISQMPDGRILFVKMNDKNIDIFAIDETGGGEKQLTKDNGFNMQPIASPDGKYIVFNSNRNGSYGIWRMNADGTNPVQLTNFPQGSDGQMQYADGGKAILFTRHRNDGARAVIMKVSIDGGEAAPLLPDVQAPNMLPKVSPDGKKLAFHTFTYDSSTAKLDASIKIVELENAQVKNTEKEVALSLRPEFRWSPDGKALTYINRQGVDNLWNLSIEDRKETPMTDFNSGNISNFVWSQDKKKIFLVRSIVNTDLVLVKDTSKG